MNKCTIIQCATVLLFVWISSNAEKCESNNIHLDCPGPDEPYDFTRCCTHENTTDVYCCEDPLHAKSNRLIMIISVSVIVSCFIISVLIVVCCFWSRCPLFDSCWVNYTKRGVIAYTKEEEALNQPPDENEYCHQYAPINMKISKVDDV